MIFLDLFASSPESPRFLEIPYAFRTRHSGASKLDAMVASEYVMLIPDKLFRHGVPMRFSRLGIVMSKRAGLSTERWYTWEWTCTNGRRRSQC
jgi:hypothetical protein